MSPPNGLDLRCRSSVHALLPGVERALFIGPCDLSETGKRDQQSIGQIFTAGAPNKPIAVKGLGP